MKFKCMNIIKLNKFSEERGSSSVLVIMIMLLLITFGVLAMMSSYSNLKMSKKNAEWTKTFYILESQAKEDIQEFNQVYEDTIQYVTQVQKQATSQMSKTELDKIFLLKLYELCRLNELISDKIEICNFKEEKELNVNSVKYHPTLQFLALDLTTNRTFLSKIEIDLQMPYLTKEGYKITEWCEIPKSFQYDEQLNFEDPEGN